MANWNPWHGCRKYSEGCQHCYVYRIDSAHGKDASQIFLNKDFDLPLRRRRDKSYLLPPGSRVKIQAIPCSFKKDAARSICVDFPQPSIPSKVKNNPRIRFSFILHTPAYADKSAFSA